MAIAFEEGGPQGIESRLDEWVPDVQRAVNLAVPDGRAETPSLSDGYKAYFPSLNQIQSGDLFTDGESTQWRYLIMAGDIPIGELELDRDGQPVALHNGPAKDGLVTAIEKANALEHDYVASVVISPALRFVALWLRRAGGELVMPYPPNATSLEDYKAVPVATVVDTLQPLAEHVMSAMAGAGDKAIGG